MAFGSAALHFWAVRSAAFAVRAVTGRAFAFALLRGARALFHVLPAMFRATSAVALSVMTRAMLLHVRAATLFIATEVMLPVFFMAWTTVMRVRTFLLGMTGFMTRRAVFPLVGVTRTACFGSGRWTFPAWTVSTTIIHLTSAFTVARRAAAVSIATATAVCIATSGRGTIRAALFLAWSGCRA